MYTANFKYDMLILIMMFFMHYIGDFIVQTSFVASSKQKSFWDKYVEENRMYISDYKPILFLHSFSWTVCILLPIVLYTLNTLSISAILISLVVNIIIHTYVDNLKANKLKINLILDQAIHIIQITLTWYILLGLL